MSISYQDALSSLQAMFGEKWTEQNLDTVLRHYQGHMENTVEALLNHGEKEPHLLLEKLKNGESSTSTNNTSLDEELARSLSAQGRNLVGSTRNNDNDNNSNSSNNNDNTTTGGTGASSSSSSSPTIPSLPNYQTRGTPTTLPEDFLRVNSTTSQSTLDTDEALARMLQDQLFSEELRRNPDFAHLAGRPRVSNVHHGSASGVGRNSFAARNGQQQPMPLPNIMEKLSEMGTSAKFKLTQMAEQFKNNTNKLATNLGGTGGAGMGSANSPSRGNEMRGLLDRDSNDYELASRKDL